MTIAIKITIAVLCVAGFFLLASILVSWRYWRAIRQTRAWLIEMGVPIDESFRPAGSTATSENEPASVDIRSLWGYPPPRDQVLEAIEAGDAIAEGWDYAIHVHEGAEAYLGAPLSYGLEERFATIPGVEACLQEDREVFLVKAASLDAEALRASIWREFLAAAHEAMATNSEPTTPL